MATEEQLRAAMAADTEGQLLLGRLEACECAALFPPGTVADALALVAADTPHCVPPWDHVLARLKALDAGTSAQRLNVAFLKEYPGGFDVCRVMTEATYTGFLCGPISSAEINGYLPEREADFHVDSNATPPAGSARLPPMLSAVRLGRQDGSLFATSADSWSKLMGSGAGDFATKAAHALAIPYESGEFLVLIRASAAAGHQWNTCRRPSVVDGSECQWWKCWPDDQLHLGHTVDLDALLKGAVSRGCQEWVLFPSLLDTSAGAVTAQHLGPTRMSTSRSSFAANAVEAFRSSTFNLHSAGTGHDVNA